MIDGGLGGPIALDQTRFFLRSPNEDFFLRKGHSPENRGPSTQKFPFLVGGVGVKSWLGPFFYLI
jgi:hypothetical protein